MNIKTPKGDNEILGKRSYMKSFLKDSIRNNGRLNSIGRAYERIMFHMSGLRIA